MSLSIVIINVFCCLLVAWMTMMRRISEDAGGIFQSNMEQYELGFGRLYDSFWLGLEYVHRITAAYATELRVDTFNKDYNESADRFENFTVSSKENNYILTVNTYVKRKYFSFKIIN